ncbi:hypothetical protein AYO49_04770 [Verrucomicrobiaceae bacterium SCGC AG-212-N21]|nr:hypothetical protein AYO49_04770 [Verrucomicrobiaceae bacterium SCGC AG-212-N21]
MMHHDPAATPSPPAPEAFLSEKQLAARWACSGITVRRRARAGALTPVKLGRLTRYRISEVLAIESAGTKASLIVEG